MTVIGRPEPNLRRSPVVPASEQRERFAGSKPLRDDVDLRPVHRGVTDLERRTLPAVVRHRSTKPGAGLCKRHLAGKSRRRVSRHSDVDAVVAAVITFGAVGSRPSCACRGKLRTRLAVSKSARGVEDFVGTANRVRNWPTAIAVRVRHRKGDFSVRRAGVSRLDVYHGENSRIRATVGSGSRLIRTVVQLVRYGVPVGIGGFSFALPKTLVVLDVRSGVLGVVTEPNSLGFVERQPEFSVKTGFTGAVLVLVAVVGSVLGRVNLEGCVDEHALTDHRAVLVTDHRAHLAGGDREGLAFQAVVHE